jgi:hypothetical protein
MTPSGELLKQIETLLLPIRKESKYIEFGTDSMKAGLLESIEMHYKGFIITIQIKSK